jgi:ferritin-like protein
MQAPTYQKYCQAGEVFAFLSRQREHSGVERAAPRAAYHHRCGPGQAQWHRLLNAYRNSRVCWYEYSRVSSNGRATYRRIRRCMPRGISEIHKLGCLSSDRTEFVSKIETEKHMANEGYHEPIDELSSETRDMHRAIVSLMEELEAVDWYDQRVDACEDEALSAILAHNRDEEKEHASMILEWIRRNDPTFNKELKDYLFTEKPIAHS